MRDKSKVRRLPGVVAAALLTLACMAPAVRAAGPVRLDWSHWDQVPVYHNGRIMPLDTFAHNAVEIICHRENPTLDLKGALSADEFSSAESAAARSLFPGDEPRRFKASELLLSWLVEPEKWDEVPFLIAEHDELRKLLGVPVTNAEGTHLKYVSPEQVRESDGFKARLGELAEKRRQAAMEGTEFQLAGVDKKFDDLVQALSLFRQLTFSPTLDAEAAGNLSAPVRRAGGTWSKIDEDLQLFSRAGESASGLEEVVGRARAALGQLVELDDRGNVVLDQVEPVAAEFAQSTALLSQRFATFQKRLLAEPPPGWSDEQLKNARTKLAELAWQTKRLAADADEIELALYENGKPLRVVPALNAKALEKDRDTEDRAQPWLDLQSLLSGSPRALAGYPARGVQSVRSAFEKLRQVYPQRDDRPNDFAAALGELSASLRQLGEDVEPLRAHLPIKSQDVELIKYTRYPAAGATGIEVRYNKLQPFQWSWVVNLFALCAFGLFMIGIRSRLVFAAGMLVLAGALVWAAYGFYMRIAITGWAPVTNMYETVIYVPFFVAMLGAWFALLPIIWPGLKAGWRLTALPGTWEARDLAAEETALLRRETWSLLSFLLTLPRAALSAVLLWALAWAPYAAGGRTVINLLPNVDAGQSLPDTNDLMTWAVGLCVLVPTVWYLPRAILSLAMSPVLVPLAMRGQGAQLIPQMYARWPFGLAASFIAFFGAFVAWYSPVLDGNFHPLQPVLRDNFWLMIHVLTIVSSYGAGALAWGLGNIALAFYLFGRYRDPLVAHAVPAGYRPAPGDTHEQISLARRPPEQCDELAGFVYKAVQVAVVLLATGTILGALWADVAWGRFWGWDPKEVWALISLLVYLAILHGRYAGLVGNFGLCVGSVLGASAIIMSWYGVNFVLGAGLHSYGFGAGGQWHVLGAVALNWVFTLGASLRYLYATKTSLMIVPPGGVQPRAEQPAH